MIETNNPMFWWLPAMAQATEHSVDYLARMAELHQNTPLAPLFATGASIQEATATNLERFAEATMIVKPIPEYTVEMGGVLRPAAWN